MTGSDGSGDGPRWRVFISHTSELRNFPRGKSYVAEVERAISAAGHVIVDMADFPAADQPAAQVCVDRVRSCDVYVGVLGTRYGSPVRDKPEASYTELEFDTATQAGMDRLVFLLDTDAEDVGIPLAQLIDREFGTHQDAFRRKVRDSGLVTQSFANPAQLGRLVERSLRDLADTRQRIVGQIQHEQVPAEPPPRVVGERVSTAVAVFRDRVEFRAKLRDLVLSREKPIICVTGRRGIGKSGLVARVLADFEQPADETDDRVGALAYLSTRTDVKVLDLARIFHALADLLPQDQRDRLEKQWTNVRTGALPGLLAALRPRNAVLVLDDLDGLQDPETGEFTNPEIVTFLTAVCRDPQPPLVVTTSRYPVELPLEILGRFAPLEIDDGLEADDAVELLRELDAYDRLRDLPDGELRQAVERVYRMPRCIQLLVHLLGRRRRTATLRRLLDAKDTPEALLSELVSEGFHSLDEVGRDVVRLLALADTPLPADALPEMLADEHPPDAVARTVEQLDDSQMIDIDPSNDRVRLHPIDSDYVRGILLADQGKRAALDLRLADWLATQRTDPETWRTSADVGPQRREIRHRLRAGDGHGAVRTMADIAEFLARHGDGGQLTDVLEQGLRYADTPAARAAYELSRGSVEFFVGSLDEAIAAFGAGRDAAEEAGDHILTAQLDSWLGVALRHAGDAVAALEPLERASRLPMSDPVSREIVIGAVFHRGLAACYLDDIAEAEGAVALTEEMLREDDPSLWWGNLADLRTLVALLQGDYTRALAEVERGIACYADSPNQDNIGYLINVRGLVLLAQGRTSEAAREFTAVREAAAALRYARLAGFAALNLAWVQLSEGNRLAAAATAREAADLLAANRVREAESARALAAAAEAGEVDAILQGLRLAVSMSQGNPDLYQPSNEVLADLARGQARARA
jgi:tetratricopeptide (TPR) repeat protein